jgi:anti-sigma B factor antagonist
VRLDLRVRHEHDKTVVEVGGELDVHVVGQLRECVRELIDDGRHHLVIDLRDVDFIDSSGLGALVAARKGAQAGGGSIRLVCTDGPVLKLLRVTALTQVFPITPTLDEALAA